MGDIPEVVLDYFFMGEEKKVVPHIGIRDRKSGAYMASALDGKTTTYAIAF